MSKVIAPSARHVQYNGTHGNKCVAHLYATLAAAAINTTVVLGEFDATLNLTDFRLVHGALGSGVTLDLGIEYPDETPDEPTAIATALAAATAGQKTMSSAPVQAKKRNCKLIATVKGGVATGRIDLIADYYNGE